LWTYEAAKKLTGIYLSDIKELRMNGFGGMLIVLGVFAFGIAQFVAGFEGISDWLGSGWAWAALILALLFRFTLPITIGAFLGAVNVWGWHWSLAALFAAPGLAFAIPGVLAWLVSLVRR
jgi:hypothetical protein